MGKKGEGEEIWRDFTEPWLLAQSSTTSELNGWPMNRLANC